MGKENWNRCDFKCLRNVARVVRERTWGGRLFQTVGAAARKAREPNDKLDRATDRTLAEEHVKLCRLTEFATSSRQIWSNNYWKLDLLRIYAVELAALLETGSRLPTGEYTPRDTTQLNSTCSVFNFYIKSVGRSSWASCEFNTHPATPTRLNCRVEFQLRDSTRHLSRVGVGDVYWA